METENLCRHDRRRTIPKSNIQLVEICLVHFNINIFDDGMVSNNFCSFTISVRRRRRSPNENKNRAQAGNVLNAFFLAAVIKLDFYGVYI